MRYDAFDGTARPDAVWWMGTGGSQPWRRRVAAIAHALRVPWTRRGRPRVSPLSREWLLQHQADAAKHSPDW